MSTTVATETAAQRGANVIDVAREKLSGVDFERDAKALTGAALPEILRYVERTFGSSAALASSFSIEDVLIIHEAAKHAPSMRIFTLDTGRLPPETYELIEVLRNRYGTHVETFSPKAADVEALVTEKGHFSFKQSLEERHRCCGIRKVEPLNRALSTRSAWITGLRREQSPTRAAVAVLERDASHGGIAKLNPLADWTELQVWQRIREERLPYNALYDRGFRSIGCAPCTRALKPWEELRDGRWWWERPEEKECGLHVSR